MNPKDLNGYDREKLGRLFFFSLQFVEITSDFAGRFL